MREKIFIKGNVPSSKNAIKFSMKTKTAFYNKNTTKYIRESKQDYLINKNKFLEMIKDKKTPYTICFKFIRDSYRRFDYSNIVQIVQDLMVKYGYLEDDNQNYLIPKFIQYEKDKNNPGVYIWIE